MSTCPRCAGGVGASWSRTAKGGRAGWREGGPGRFARALFLAALAGFALAGVERAAGGAAAPRAVAALPAPAAAQCPQGTGLESLLPPGHPPVPGLGAAPRLPPGHPPIGPVPGAPIFRQDAPRTL